MKKKKGSTSKPSERLAKQVLNEPDVEAEALEKSRLRLEEKARLYEKLQQGEDVDGEVSEAMRENLLIDFDRQFFDQKLYLNVTTGLEEYSKEDEVIEEMVEYEDEFGRTRKIPKNQYDSHEKERAARLADEIIQQARSTTNFSGADETSGPGHFDDSIEIRRKGVGFYRFAQEEGQRQRQMSELSSIRKETVESRTKNMILGEQRRQMKEERLKKVAERRKKQQKEE